MHPQSVRASTNPIYFLHFSAWKAFSPQYSFYLYGETSYSIVVAFIVPILFLWIFERMLHNSFLLQKTLELRSK